MDRSSLSRRLGPVAITVEELGGGCGFFVLLVWFAYFMVRGYFLFVALTYICSTGNVWDRNFCVVGNELFPVTGSIFSICHV